MMQRLARHPAASMGLPNSFYCSHPQNLVMRICVVIGVISSLSACQSFQSSDNVLGVITPYRVEVVQGNVVTQEQIALIKPGMTRSQVRDVLGSPLLTDIFHENRWDYVFTIKRQGAEPQRRSVVVTFDGDSLQSIQAPELPQERSFVASIDTFKSTRKSPVLELSAEQIKALPAPKAVAADKLPETTAAPTREYPPLESR